MEFHAEENNWWFSSLKAVKKSALSKNPTKNLFCVPTVLTRPNLQLHIVT